MDCNEIRNAIGKMANDTQRVINTLEGLNITSSFDNMNRLLGSIQVLGGIRDMLADISGKMEEDEQKATAKEKKHGNTDAE